MLVTHAPHRLLLAASVCISLTLAACDASVPSATGPDAEQVLPKGPSLSAFPADALFSPDEVERSLSSLARRADGDTLVIVPLVFDETSSLYSAEGYNQLIASAAKGDGSGVEEPDVFFTDLDTFMDVIGRTSRRAGGSYEALYADGRQHRMPSGATDLGAG